ncbi:MAG: phenylalanine 4-monooxygenase [Gemmatimonadaceae bacterium]|nr:phenylalanine 4-monooxygenase [Gemmatimonadaceae bacterium]
MQGSVASAQHTFPAFIDQEYEQYTSEDHDVWKVLYERRMNTLENTASRLFLDGASTIGLSPESVPALSDVNKRLAARTGWSAVGVSGFIPAAQFFRCLGARRFPTTLRVRPRAQLDYLPEPDIFHDVFGHVPLHADPVFADFLQRFGELGDACESDEQTQALARLFWFTVEFGLIRESGSTRVYGSGLISSHGDAANALSDKCERRSFSLSDVIQTSFRTDEIQPVLYEIGSFNDLFVAVEELASQFRS